MKCNAYWKKKSEKRDTKEFKTYKVLYKIKCEILFFFYLVKFYSVYFVCS